jgi:hypothetical protein
MDKTTGNTLLIDGNEVWGHTEFSLEGDASRSSGTIEVVFSFDGSALTDEVIVVFEYLYEGDELLLAHEDLNEIDQTVIVETVPEPIAPPKESLDQTRTVSEKEPGLPAAGDVTRYPALALGFGCAVAALTLTSRYRRTIRTTR